MAGDGGRGDDAFGAAGVIGLEAPDVARLGRGCGHREAPEPELLPDAGDGVASGELQGVAGHGVQLAAGYEIDQAVGGHGGGHQLRPGAKAGAFLAGAGVQGVEAAVGGGDVHDAVVANGGRGTQLAQGLMLPDAFTGGGVEGVGDAVQGAGIDDAVGDGHGAGSGIAQPVFPADLVGGGVAGDQAAVGHCVVQGAVGEGERVADGAGGGEGFQFGSGGGVQDGDAEVGAEVDAAVRDDGRGQGGRAGNGGAPGGPALRFGNGVGDIPGLPQSAPGHCPLGAGAGGVHQQIGLAGQQNHGVGDKGEVQPGDEADDYQGHDGDGEVAAGQQAPAAGRLLSPVRQGLRGHPGIGIGAGFGVRGRVGGFGGIGGH